MLIKERFSKLTLPKRQKEYENTLPTVLEHWQDSISGVNDDDLTTCLNVLNRIKANLEEKLHMQI